MGEPINDDRSLAAMRLLLSVESDAFVWTLRAPMPSRLREAFAFHPVGSGRNGYRITLMIQNAQLKVEHKTSYPAIRSQPRLLNPVRICISNIASVASKMITEVWR